MLAENALDSTISKIASLVSRNKELEAKLAQVAGWNEWHEPPELPPHVGVYWAVWAEDGAWVAEYWPRGIHDEHGINSGCWMTHPDGSIRTDPIAWRHPPSVPAKYVQRIEMGRE